MKKRGFGILLHVSSLPGPHGVGDFGQTPELIGFLTACGASSWQVLPLSPTSTFIGNSPYSSDSAFAGNILFLSPEWMVEDGLLSCDDLADLPELPRERCDFHAAEKRKLALVGLAFERFGQDPDAAGDFAAFRRGQAHWLADYSLFRALKNHFGGAAWTDWTKPLRDREPAALEAFGEALAQYRLEIEFGQWIFWRQWERVRALLAKACIQVVGDAPIYVTHDSADVWANRELFRLDGEGRCTVVAGVPPDYFSEDGQRWGNPLYDWDRHQATRYAWWVRRMRHALSLYDVVRLDHFRGFEAYWEIPASERTARNGRWVCGPGLALFDRLAACLPSLPIIAEDLGVITPAVRELRDQAGFPGMRVLQFAFGDTLPDSPDAPHRHVEHAVAYTGTHDNTTTLGWWRTEADQAARDRFAAYAGASVSDDDAAWHMIRLALASVAALAVIPMQDVLGLDGEARMNTPSLAAGNWSWRVPDQAFAKERAARLFGMARLFGRASL